jgi:hypothetical protein
MLIVQHVGEVSIWSHPEICPDHYDRSAFFEGLTNGGAQRQCLYWRNDDSLDAALEGSGDDIDLPLNIVLAHRSIPVNV